MTAADWNNLAITVLGVFGLAVASRRAKAVLKLPSVAPWIPFAVYNLLWAAGLFAGSRSGVTLPQFAAPIGLVGGNAALFNLFGFPWGGKVTPGEKDSAALRDPALDREKLEPRRRKKKRSGGRK